MFAAVLALVATLAGSAGGSEILKVDDVTLLLPDNWTLGSDSLEFPLQIVQRNLTAELLIFRSVIWAEEAINDEYALRIEVEKIVDDVIPALPESQLLSSHGYYENHRASFFLEFRSLDTLQNLILRHRMAGVVYRHPDGHQLLFTLWGKSLSEAWSAHEGEIKLMQSEFAYTGPFEEEVFGDPNEFPWYAFFALMVVIGLLYAFRSFRTRHNTVEFADDQIFWHCGGCGRLNPQGHRVCKRCGRPQPTAETT